MAARSPADASRIIAVDINGTLGSIVFSLGLGSRMVGRDTSTIFPAAVGLPVVTNRGHSLNAEMVLKLRPSVLLINQDTTPAGAIDQIRNSGILSCCSPPSAVSTTTLS